MRTPPGRENPQTQQKGRRSGPLFPPKTEVKNGDFGAAFFPPKNLKKIKKIEKKKAGKKGGILGRFRGILGPSPQSSSARPSSSSGKSPAVTFWGLTKAPYLGGHSK